MYIHSWKVPETRACMTNLVSATKGDLSLAETYSCKVRYDIHIIHIYNLPKLHDFHPLVFRIFCFVIVVTNHLLGHENLKPNHHTLDPSHPVHISDSPDPQDEHQDNQDPIPPPTYYPLHPFRLY